MNTNLFQAIAITIITVVTFAVLLYDSYKRKHAHKAR